MKKFKVEIKEVNYYTIEVEAETEEEAEEIAVNDYITKSPDEMYVDEVNVEELLDVNNLTKEQLWDLRQQICLGSIYINDYENNYGISAEVCCCFFDGFLEDCWELAEENKLNIPDIESLYERFDNTEDLYNYYYGIEYPFGE